MEFQRVLIVDDSATMRMVLAGMVEAEGFEVVGALPSGHGLLDAVEQRTPDIICLDHELPGQTGLELLAVLQRQHPDVAVVMITGAASTAVVQDATRLGTSAFIAKPFNQVQVGVELRRVREALDKLSTARPLGSRVSRRIPEGEGRCGRAVIADDSRAYRMLLSAVLQDIGVTVVGAATNGREAVELCERQAPDLVCLDVEMPELSGVKALESIRAALPDILAVMVTSQASKKLVLDAVANGAQGYIVKPFDVESVKATLNALLEKHRRERAP
jgi:two-component system chemotaxis response regulator CheY